MSLKKIPDGISFLSGNNFSGRSRFLKSIAFPESTFPQVLHLLIQEQPSNNISGIFPTVKDEIALHTPRDKNQFYYDIMGLFESYGFQKHFEKNPLSLSGGEQTILSILCNLLLQPATLCIDSTIEQLNHTWYLPLFNFLCTNVHIKSKIFISDNRYLEYGLSDVNVVTPNEDRILHKYIFEKPCFIGNVIEKTEGINIQLESVSFAYNKQNSILNNLNYNFESSSIYHLSGKNGAGKSTLAKLLVGAIKLKKGSILIKGKPYNSFRYPGCLCGYSFQNPDEQLFSNTVECEILPLKRNELKEWAERRELFLTMFGLQKIRKEHPAEMPFVIRKRIALASTLAMDKPWYVLDEPTLGQDNEFVDFLVLLLNHLRDSGKGIILITHCNYLINNLNIKTLNLSK